jgi:hypothetical protein
MKKIIPATPDIANKLYSLMDQYGDDTHLFRGIEAGQGISITLKNVSSHIDSQYGKKIVISSPNIGEPNSALNLGNGAQLYVGKHNSHLTFKTLIAGSGIKIDTTALEVKISLADPNEEKPAEFTQLKSHLDVNGFNITGTGNIKINPTKGNVVVSGMTLPNNAGKLGYVLTTDGSSQANWLPVPVLGLSDVAGDSEPQLGGDLDLNGYSIVNKKGDITITPLSGTVVINGIRFPDTPGGKGQTLLNDGTGNLSWGIAESRHSDIIRILSPIALSGNYNDLIAKPALSKVAMTGQYSDLLGLPTPTQASQTKSTGHVNNITIFTQHGNYAASPDDHVIIIKKYYKATTGVTLPAVPMNKMFIIKDGSGIARLYPITIVGSSNQRIDGTESAIINTDWGCIYLVWTGSDWCIL